jgi:hypothetical protein
LITDAAAPFILAIHHFPTQLMLHELDRRLLDEVVFGVGTHLGKYLLFN